MRLPNICQEISLAFLNLLSRSFIVLPECDPAVFDDLFEPVFG
jgi:hypothetical protein